MKKTVMIAHFKKQGQDLLTRLPTLSDTQFSVEMKSFLDTFDPKPQEQKPCPSQPKS